MNTTKLRATNLVRELTDLIQEIHDSGDCGNMLSDVLEMVNKICSKPADKSQVRITDEMISRAMGVVIGYSGDYGTHNDYLTEDTAREVLEAALSASGQAPADKPARITEQDAREIINTYIDNKIGVPVNEWLKPLLNKLNAGCEPADKEKHNEPD